MKEITSISELPSGPAVYAIYGGRAKALYVAYVGVANSLKRRMSQHLVSRDSSVAVGTFATGLHPDNVTEVRWWGHADFSKPYVLTAAELVAFDVLDPTLRSRGKPQGEARRLYESSRFKKKMRSIFEGEPTGRMIVLRLQDVLEKIADLEQRLDALEARFTRE